MCHLVILYFVYCKAKYYNYLILITVKASILLNRYLLPQQNAVLLNKEIYYQHDNCLTATKLLTHIQYACLILHKSLNQNLRVFLKSVTWLYSLLVLCLK